MDTNDKKLNILAILPHSIAGRLIVDSMASGFTALGHNVVKYDEISHTRALTPESDLNFDDFIKNKEFDYIIGYDFSPLKLKVDYNLECPCLNYFGDEIDKPTAGEGFVEYKKALERPDSWTFYWDEALCAKHPEIKNLYYLPHFVDTDIYSPQNIPKEYDVMFCGRLDTDFRLNLWVEMLREMPDVNFAWFAIKRHYEDALSRVCDTDKKLIEKTYRGFIDNEPDMALEMNKAKIVFNVHSQGAGSFNYRTFQAMACGVLMLCDYRKEGDSLFKNNEIVYWQNFDEIKANIYKYLSDKNAYNEVAKNARACAVKNHSARACALKMLQIVKSTCN